MKRRNAVLAAVGCLVSVLAAPVCGQDTPVPAKAQQAAPAQAAALLKTAQEQAKKQHKTVWVMFHASW